MWPLGQKCPKRLRLPTGKVLTSTWTGSCQIRPLGGRDWAGSCGDGTPLRINMPSNPRSAAPGVAPSLQPPSNAQSGRRRSLDFDMSATIEFPQEPMIRPAPDPEQADVLPCEHDDVVQCRIEISETIPTSPGLLCIDPHASFSHVQGERRIIARCRSQANFLHGLWMAARTRVGFAVVAAPSCVKVFVARRRLVGTLCQVRRGACLERTRNTTVRTSRPGSRRSAGGWAGECHKETSPDAFDQAHNKQMTVSKRGGVGVRAPNCRRQVRTSSPFTSVHDLDRLR